MFKQRLKETGLAIIYILALLLGVACVIGVMYAFAYFITASESGFKVMETILISAFVVTILYLTGTGLYHLYKFVYWLFIEPFQKKKDEDV